MKFWKIPTPLQVDRAVTLISQVEQYRYFFDRLQNPEWIIPLKEKGFFKDPPKILKDEERHTVGFPPWAESRYLARMAALKPDVVYETILLMADTENIRVHEDRIDAALNMPPELAVQLVKVKESKKWIGSPYKQLLPQKFGALIIHLTRGGQVEHALKLARVLLEVIPDSSDDKELEKSEPLTFPRTPQPTSHCGQWSYDQILKQIGPIIVESAKFKGLALFCGLLNSSVQISRPRTQNGPVDLSSIWWPSIEDHTQNIVPSIQSSLLIAVRDASAQLCRTDPADLPAVLQTLERRTPPWRVFTRIALYLLRKLPDVPIQLVSQYLCNQALFEDMDCRLEYSLLLQQRFPNLDPTEKETILGWAENPPTAPTLRGEVSIEDTARYERYRKLERLSRFGAYNLPGPLKSRYESFVQEFGEVPHPEFPHYISSFVGPTSPKNVNELQTMTISELVMFLKEWDAPTSFRGPSREGLGRELSSIVENDPKRFASEALQFRGLHPIYVSSFLHSFYVALRNKKSFDLHPILLLCKWVLVQQDGTIANAPDWIDEDKNWGWCRTSVARFLDTALRQPDGIPLSQRSDIWDILSRLSDDPDPTPEDEERHISSKNSLLDIAINSTRGIAMEAIIHYGIWLHRHFEKMPDGAHKVARGFDEMPEVRELLDSHLDPSYDPSLAVHAVIGAMLPWLAKLDRSWVQDRIPTIFPSDGTLRPLRNAAWETYLTSYQPSDELFDILREQYLLGVETSVSEYGRGSPNSSSMSLVEHLMALYWHGNLALEKSEGLMEKFWSQASEPLRSYALEFIGRSLNITKDSISPKILQLLKFLWEKRLSSAKMASVPRNHNGEMVAFGWWFVSGKFDDEWSFIQLVEALKISKKTDPEHLVVERLSTLAPTMPKQAIQCLEFIVEGDSGGFGFYVWSEHARTILISALQSGEPEIAIVAKNIIHHLGSRGIHEFRALLNS